MKELLKRFLAAMHWSSSAVCELSVEGKDYHRREDSRMKFGWHLSTHICKYCGRNFQA